MNAVPPPARGVGTFPLAALRPNHLTLALHDFGSGASSLSHLSRRPIDSLK